MPVQLDLITRYKHLRQVSKELGNRLVGTLSKRDIEQGAKKLGLLVKGTLVFDSESEMTVLMDYCVYDVRRKGMNAVERMLAQSPPAPDSDEILILQAMREARYGVLLMEHVQFGEALQVLDLLRGERFDLTDMSLSQTGQPGLVLAARVYEVDGITMTSGAPLPLGGMPANNRAEFLESMRALMPPIDPENLDQKGASELTACIIRTALHVGASEYTSYQDPDDHILREDDGSPFDNQGAALPSSRPAPLTATPRTGRNDACPCGSGKKFKRCCGGRR